MCSNRSSGVRPRHHAASSSAVPTDEYDTADLSSDPPGSTAHLVFIAE